LLLEHAHLAGMCLRGQCRSDPVGSGALRARPEPVTIWPMSVIRGTLPDVFARLLVLTAAFGLAFVAGRATVPAPNTPEAAPPHHEVAGIPVAELPVDCEARRERV